MRNLCFSPALRERNTKWNTYGRVIFRYNLPLNMRVENSACNEISACASKNETLREPLTFAPHTPVDEWLATQDVAKWREKWLRDDFVVVKGFVDPNEVVTENSHETHGLSASQPGRRAHVFTRASLYLAPVLVRLYRPFRTACVLPGGVILDMRVRLC